jgi:hypothetical protein
MTPANFHRHELQPPTRLQNQVIAGKPKRPERRMDIQAV